jgi:serine/threonine protein kinase
MSPRDLDPAHHARAADIFLAAVELLPQEQQALLARECADNRELLEMIEHLLAEDRNGSILPEPKAAPSPPRESLIGLTLSHYRVLEPVGEGGMGTVYRATDTRLDRTVALKFNPSQLLRDTGSRDRFWREAKTIASSDHPNVCPVYGMEEDGAFLFIAMAYLDGIPLDRRIASGWVSINEAFKIAIQAGQGLEAAHGKGVVHRDIKPANLMLTSTPFGDQLVRILDFGIAQSIRESAGVRDESTVGTGVLHGAGTDPPGAHRWAGRPLVAWRGSLRDAIGAIAVRACVRSRDSRRNRRSNVSGSQCHAGRSSVQPPRRPPANAGQGCRQAVPERAGASRRSRTGCDRDPSATAGRPAAAGMWSEAYCSRCSCLGWLRPSG